MRPEIPGCLALLALLAPAQATETAPGPRPDLGAEVWRLRPADSGSAAVAPSPPDPRRRPATEIPEARRNVRMVYPALTEAR